jgi:thymidylate kinase
MFIVLEGIDGAGKGRQRVELSSFLQSRVKELHSYEFPDHQGVMYRELIKPSLLEKIDLSKNALFLAFVLDQLLYQEKITKALGKTDSFFICDGYFTTNLVYNCLAKANIPLKTALQLAEDFEIAQADLNIFIDVDPKIAQSRKLAEAGHDEGLDVYERDLAKQYKLREGYLKLAQEDIFGPWEIVPGNGSIEEVRELIIKVLFKHKYLK